RSPRPSRSKSRPPPRVRPGGRSRRSPLRAWRPSPSFWRRARRIPATNTDRSRMLIPMPKPKRGRGRPALSDQSHPVTRRRLAKRWTRAQLARVADVSLATINTVERGDRQPEFHTVRKIAKALRTHIVKLATELLRWRLREQE